MSEIAINFDEIDGPMWIGVNPSDRFALTPFELFDVVFHEVLHWWRGGSGVEEEMSLDRPEIELVHEQLSTKLIEHVYKPLLDWESQNAEIAVSVWGNDREFSTITGIFRTSSGGLRRFPISEVEFNRAKGGCPFDRISHHPMCYGTAGCDITEELQQRGSPAAYLHGTFGGTFVADLLYRKQLEPILLN
ncbi:MAG: hypothetical protein LBJ70_01115 [Holosporales bacterium]|nr:hypothetical protein [Holosporales bacterium]